MRVNFGNHIDLCKRIRLTDDGLLLITTYNSVYTVDCGSYVKASAVYNQAFINGCIDVSRFEYSN